MASYAPLNLLIGKELLTKDGSLTLTESFFEGKIIGLYFSAHWSDLSTFTHSVANIHRLISLQVWALQKFYPQT